MIRALYQRLTGAEARALRHQRDAYAEQAGKERQRADTAERERDAATALLRALARDRTEAALAEAAEWLRRHGNKGD